MALAQLFISSDRSSWRYDALIHSSLCMTKLASEMHKAPQIFSTIFREGVKNWGKGGKVTIHKVIQSYCKFAIRELGNHLNSQHWWWEKKHVPQQPHQHSQHLQTFWQQHLLEIAFQNWEYSCPQTQSYGLMYISRLFFLDNIIIGVCWVRVWMYVASCGVWLLSTWNSWQQW